MRVTPRGRHHYDGRSQPGAGQRITLYGVDADAAAQGCHPIDCCFVDRDAEDYAAGRQRYPVIVKAQPQLSRAALVRHLTYLLAQLVEWDTAMGAESEDR
jgi:hypothetical protein